MTLIKYNPETIEDARLMNMALRLTINGPSCFSAGARERMQLSPGDNIEIIEHQEANLWYIAKCEYGFRLRTRTNQQDRQLFFNSAPLVKIIFDRLNLEGNSHKFRIGRNPIALPDMSEPVWQLIDPSKK